MDYTEIFKIIKELIMKSSTFRFVWLTIVFLLALLIWRPDIIKIIADLFQAA